MATKVMTYTEIQGILFNGQEFSIRFSPSEARKRVCVKKYPSLSSSNGYFAMLTQLENRFLC